MQKGYRLTPEEEAIMRGEIPGDPSSKETDEQNNQPGKKPKGVKAILPILVALGMMIGISYFFIFLIGGNPSKEQPATKHSQNILISPEQKAVFTRKLDLSDEESAAFWPMYTRFREEMAEIKEKQEKWLSEQGKQSLKTISYPDFILTYTSGYKELKKTTLRFSEAFAALLGEERIPLVFMLYEEWK